MTDSQIAKCNAQIAEIDAQVVDLKSKLEKLKNRRGLIAAKLSIPIQEKLMAKAVASYVNQQAKRRVGEERARLIGRMIKDGSTLKSIGEKIGMHPSLIRGFLRKHEHGSSELSVRACNVLSNAGVNLDADTALIVEAIDSKTDREWLRYRNFGRVCLIEIREWADANRHKNAQS